MRMDLPSMPVYTRPPWGGVSRRTLEVQLLARAVHERAAALELLERGSHRVELAVDLFRPGLSGVVIECLQAVAGDDRHDRVVRREAPGRCEFLEHRDRGATGRLGQEALGGRGPVE